MNKTKLASLILSIVSIPMAIDTAIIKLPGIPAGVTMYWPLVLALASALHKWASTMQEKTPQVK